MVIGSLKNKPLITKEIKYQNMPDAIFNVSGLFVYTPLILELIDIVRSKFQYKVPIKFIHGGTNCLWGGGRNMIKSFGFTKSVKAYENEFFALKKRGIKPLLTFSNHLIEKNELEDKESNEILEIVNEFNCGVIVSSYLLKNYIYQKYPNVEITASAIIPALSTKKRDKDLYNILEYSFKKYVLHPDDNFNIPLLFQLKKQKAEILINERCLSNCKIRAKHYDSIVYCNKNKTQNHFMRKCKSLPLTKQKRCTDRNITLSLVEVEYLYKLGFRNFKIQGRADNPYLYFFDLTRFMLDSQIIAPTAFSIMTDCINNFIKNGVYEL